MTAFGRPPDSQGAMCPISLDSPGPGAWRGAETRAKTACMRPDGVIYFDPIWRDPKDTWYGWAGEFWAVLVSRRAEAVGK